LKMPTSRLKFRLAEDGLVAWLSVATGPALSSDEFDAAIRNSGIVFGLVLPTKNMLEAALSDPNFVCDDEVLARGQAPVPPVDARFEPAFSAGVQAGHVREDGTLDLHDRELLKPVHVGDLLGLMHSPREGTEGRRLDGELLPVSKPHPLTLSLLSGVSVDSDGCVRAARDGVILYKPLQTLDVVDRHEHRGSVDLHSGDLNMQGSLVIKGDVSRPFAVAASGDVDIVGSIDSASVLAGGHLRVQGGVRGGDGGSVCAEGDMRLHHVEAAELYCGGQLQVEQAVNSQLNAHEIRVAKRLRGGIATAEARITVSEVGAPNGVATRLVAGEPLENPVLEVKRAIATAKAERAASRRGGRNDDRAKGGKAGRARASLAADDLQRAAERARCREALLDTASIQVVLAHPGVEIAIGEARLTLEAPVRSARYSLERESCRLRCEPGEIEHHG
jgi:uncharacterized protein (DUF342 family)